MRLRLKLVGPKRDRKKWYLRNANMTENYWRVRPSSFVAPNFFNLTQPNSIQSKLNPNPIQKASWRTPFRCYKLFGLTRQSFSVVLAFQRYHFFRSRFGPTSCLKRTYYLNKYKCAEQAALYESMRRDMARAWLIFFLVWLDGTLAFRLIAFAWPSGVRSSRMSKLDVQPYIHYQTFLDLWSRCH